MAGARVPQSVWTNRDQRLHVLYAAKYDRSRSAIAVSHRQAVLECSFTLLLLRQVFLNVVISVVRCVISMGVNAAAPAGDVADKVFWLAVRFFLLATVRDRGPAWCETQAIDVHDMKMNAVPLLEKTYQLGDCWHTSKVDVTMLVDLL